MSSENSTTPLKLPELSTASDFKNLSSADNDCPENEYRELKLR